MHPLKTLLKPNSFFKIWWHLEISDNQNLLESAILLMSSTTTISSTWSFAVQFWFRRPLLYFATRVSIAPFGKRKNRWFLKGHIRFFVSFWWFWWYRPLFQKLWISCPFLKNLIMRFPRNFLQKSANGFRYTAFLIDSRKKDEWQVEENWFAFCSFLCSPTAYAGK